MSKEVITPDSYSNISNIIQNRFIIEQFAKRDFKIRYINSYLGYLWAVVNPLFQAIIYIVVFGFLVKIKTPEYNTSYSVVLLLGLLIWTFFNQSAEQASNVLVNNMHILKKVYFPRITLCIAATTTAAVDFIIALLVLLIILLFSNFENITISWRYLLIPIVIIGVLSLSLSLGMFLAILKVKYQDMKHAVPMIFQVLFFLSPIVYTQSLIPEKLLTLYKLNPIYGYISTFRWIFIDGSPNSLVSLCYALIISFILLVIAIRYFSLNERRIVDSE